MFSAKKNNENSFAKPMKLAPKTRVYDNFSKSFDMEFKPYSFTILRIKATLP